MSVHVVRADGNTPPSNISSHASATGDPPLAID
jgi:hypothetical protein